MLRVSLLRILGPIQIEQRARVRQAAKAWKPEAQSGRAAEPAQDSRGLTPDGGHL